MLSNNKNKGSQEDFYVDEPVNTWVGGDAYNYIINGTHATAFFVLAIGLLIDAVLLEIAQQRIKNQSMEIVASEQTIEQRSDVELMNENKEA